MGWCRRDPGRRLCRGYAKVRKSASISYAGLRIFSVRSLAHASRPWRCKMAHLITADDYRFGRIQHERSVRTARCVGARQRFPEKHDRGHRQFEDAPYRARACASRLSLRPVPIMGRTIASGCCQLPGSSFAWRITCRSFHSGHRPLFLKCAASSASWLRFWVRPGTAPVVKYRPEDHYMRGPGPKWREKHGLDAQSSRASGRAPPVNARPRSGHACSLRLRAQ